MCSSFRPVLSEYMKIIAIFYYPVLYYPLMVCSTLQHKAGYVFGTLLSFSHLTILVWQKFDCPKTPEVRRLHAQVSCSGLIILRRCLKMVCFFPFSCFGLHQGLFFLFISCFLRHNKTKTTSLKAEKWGPLVDASHSPSQNCHVLELGHHS